MRKNLIRQTVVTLLTASALIIGGAMPARGASTTVSTYEESATTDYTSVTSGATATITDDGGNSVTATATTYPGTRVDPVYAWVPHTTPYTQTDIWDNDHAVYPYTHTQVPIGTAGSQPLPAGWSYQPKTETDPFHWTYTLFGVVGEGPFPIGQQFPQVYANVGSTATSWASCITLAPLFSFGWIACADSFGGFGVPILLLLNPASFDWVRGFDEQLFGYRQPWAGGWDTWAGSGYPIWANTGEPQGTGWYHAHINYRTLVVNTYYSTTYTWEVVGTTTVPITKPQITLTCHSAGQTHTFGTWQSEFESGTPSAPHQFRVEVDNYGVWVRWMAPDGTTGTELASNLDSSTCTNGGTLFPT